MVMKLAEHISASHMKTIAIGEFDIKKAKLDNLFSRKDAEDVNCEVMILGETSQQEIRRR